FLQLGSASVLSFRQRDPVPTAKSVSLSASEWVKEIAASSSRMKPALDQSRRDCSSLPGVSGPKLTSPAPRDARKGRPHWIPLPALRRRRAAAVAAERVEEGTRGTAQPGGPSQCARRFGPNHSAAAVSFRQACQT